MLNDTMRDRFIQKQNTVQMLRKLNAAITDSLGRNRTLLKCYNNRQIGQKQVSECNNDRQIIPKQNTDWYNDRQNTQKQDTDSAMTDILERTGQGMPQRQRLRKL